jgi:hypothetical protein
MDTAWRKIGAVKSKRIRKKTLSPWQVPAQLRRAFSNVTQAKAYICKVLNTKTTLK